MVCDHVAHPPALVGHRLTDLLQQLLLDLSGCQLLRDSDQVLDGQQADGVLVVTLKATVDGQALIQNLLLRQLLDERLGK